MRRRSKQIRVRNSCIVIKGEGDTERVYFNHFSSREMPIKFATGNAKDPSGMLDDLINYINNNDYRAKA